MKNEPSTIAKTTVNGRDARGKFAPGNPGGKGNPFAGRVQKMKAIALRAVSANDMREIVEALIGRAKAGDVSAAREIFDRVLGKVKTDLSATLEVTSATPAKKRFDLSKLSVPELESLHALQSKARLIATSHVTEASNDD